MRGAMSKPADTLEDRDTFCDEVVAIAERAGEEIMRHYGGAVAVTEKADQSPVTLADQRAEALILAALKELIPDVPIVAEELCAAGEAPEVAERFVLVDPLDGTKEFISRNGEFTVNIVLIEAGRPGLGVVHLPATGVSYWTAGEDAFRRERGGRPVPICCRSVSEGEPVVVVASRSHRDARTEEFIAGLNVKEIVSAGSSLKLCRVAEGTADVYPRFGRTMEWDIAAGDAILRAAGGSVRTVAGEEFRYGKPGFENPAFVARGGIQP